MKETHSRASLMCQTYDKGFLKRSLFNIHVKKNYLTTPRLCPDRGQTAGEHMKICTGKIMLFLMALL